MGYVDRIAQSQGVSRRGFVAGAAASALAAAALAGCQPQVTADDKKKADEPEPTLGRDLVSGEWVSAACWHNCGGRCVNRALVNDGVVVRQKTDDTGDDTEGAPQQRACPRGRSQRMQVFGADRLKYPMKRKNWTPEEPHGELRGKDEWERISWDEAIEYVADQLKKTYDVYGPKGVLGCGSNGVMTALNALGGCCTKSDSSSFGTYSNGTSTSMGMCSSSDYGETTNDRYDLQKSDWVVLHGSNPAWTAPGLPVFSLLKAKEAGVQFVCIDPVYNATAQMLNARWIPVQVGTDIAFMLGVAYEMLQFDSEKGNIVDWDFLHKYCVGFDAESMPEGAATSEHFKDYVLGAYDGTPKTAQWASEICGSSVDDIKWYAELLQKGNAVSMQHGYAFARNVGAEDVGQMFLTLGCMGGHIGKEGHACGAAGEQVAFNNGPALVTAGQDGMTGAKGTISEPIPAPFLWESMLAGQYHYSGIHYVKLDKGEDRPLDIHLVAFEAAAALQTTPNMRKGIEALRKVDFVFSSAYSLNTQAKYSDIVLPCTTEWERPGGFPGSNRETLIVYSQVIEPMFEAKTDQEIGELLLKACGVDPAPIFDVSEKQQFFNQILGCTYLDEKGDSKTLVTVTDDDIKKWGCEGKPQQGVISLDDFLQKGFYHVDRSADDAYGYIAYEDFVKDPQANPLDSASGKFEIYCQAKADEFNATGVGANTIKPYPTYQPSSRGKETLSDQYPLLGYNPHYLRRSHSVLDNVTWLREAWPNPVFVSAADAASRGIENGDAVCISSPSGKAVRTACVMQSLIPGVVGIPHGCWIELDENEEYDMAGADNGLMGPETSASVVSGYNNINVNIEKYTGEVIPDCEWPQRVIEL